MYASFVVVLDTLVFANSDDVSDTSYTAIDEYVFDGFCADDPERSPKFHDHLVGRPVDVSVNVTGDPTATVVGAAEKSAPITQSSGYVVISFTIPNSKRTPSDAL